MEGGTVEGILIRTFDVVPHSPILSNRFIACGTVQGGRGTRIQHHHGEGTR